MAVVPTMVTVATIDAAERTAEITYRLNDASSFDDADAAGSIATVLSAVNTLTSTIKTASWGEVLYAEIKISVPVTDTPANVGSNNQVRAFTRTRTTSGEKSSFEIASWDDFTFDQNSQNVLSAAYDTAVADLVDILADMETGEDMESVDYSQSRTRKSRNIIHD